MKTAFVCVAVFVAVFLLHTFFGDLPRIWFAALTGAIVFASYWVAVAIERRRGRDPR